jgi:hypothetical protein
MHRFKFHQPSAARALCLLLLASLAACEADTTLCPEGFSKSGKLCLEQDDGSNATAGEHDAASERPESQQSDAGSVSSTSDAGSSDAGAQSAPSMDASREDAASTSDASSAPDATISDAAAPAVDATTEPTPECDAVHACASTGYSCMNNKCVSACAQTRCDANATCALVRGAPVCSCNRGYLPMGSGSALTCARDVGCEALNCDENASCDMAAGRPRQCVCKTGYSGDGKSCTPISCPALSTLRVTNGSIKTSDGTTTVGKVATVTCNDHYKITAGGPTLVCDETGKWVGELATCSLITCPTPTAKVEHAELMMPTQPSYRPTERATYTCVEGFKPRANATVATVTCGDDGTWSTPTLVCVATCGDGTFEQGVEACDPTANGGLGAWTCGTDCKPCAGGLCKPACTTASSCPQEPGNLQALCTSGQCVLSECSSLSSRRCPGGMCTSGTNLCEPTQPAP